MKPNGQKIQTSLNPGPYLRANHHQVTQFHGQVKTKLISENRKQTTQNRQHKKLKTETRNLKQKYTIMGTPTFTRWLNSTVRWKPDWYKYNLCKNLFNPAQLRWLSSHKSQSEWLGENQNQPQSKQGPAILRHLPRFFDTDTLGREISGNQLLTRLEVRAEWKSKPPSIQDQATIAPSEEEAKEDWGKK